MCVIYLILSAGLRMFKGLDKNALNLVLFAAVFCTMLFFSIAAVSFSTVFYILICGTVGVCAYALSRIRKGGSEQ